MLKMFVLAELQLFSLSRVCLTSAAFFPVLLFTPIEQTKYIGSILT